MGVGWSNSTGAGNDTVKVYATASPLYVANSGGLDSVFVGLGSLANIYGPVAVYGPGSTTLTVDDSADSTARPVSWTNGQISGL